MPVFVGQPRVMQSESELARLWPCWLHATSCPPHPVSTAMCACKGWHPALQVTQEKVVLICGHTRCVPRPVRDAAAGGALWVWLSLRLEWVQAGPPGQW